MDDEINENIATLKPAYSSKFISVNGHKMHYLERGTGHVMMFLHGMPVSSYVWRKIIPALPANIRCIAPDLIGMGLSDKPAIDYTVFDHIEYIEKFIDQLELAEFTLVMHGWGSVIGFDIAKRRSSSIKGLAFCESHLRSITDSELVSLPIQQLTSMLKRPGASYRAVVEQNYFIKRLLPSSMVDSLEPSAMKVYEKPFESKESRKLLWQYVLELPVPELNSSPEVLDLINNYSSWLQQSDIPKLMLCAFPGFFTTMEAVEWADEHLSHLTQISLENAMHFPQECESSLFVQALTNWYETAVLNIK